MLPRRLVEYHDNHRCVLWVGAGLSVPQDIPLWGETVRLLIQHCEDTQVIDADELTELKQLADDELWDDVLAYCQAALGTGEYNAKLKSIFLKQPNAPSRLHDRFAQLFDRIVTTNYDSLIESAYTRLGITRLPLTNQDRSTISALLPNNESFLLKIHGDIQKPETMVFTWQEYAERIYENSGLMQFLEQLFSTRSVVFIGTSLGDTYIRLLLERVRRNTFAGAPQHFAILSNVGRIRSRLLRERYNIWAVSYTPNGGDHTTPIEQLFAIL
jgi:NAD-dependent SIR2 family protein deacetylase